MVEGRVPDHGERIGPVHEYCGHCDAFVGIGHTKFCFPFGDGKTTGQGDVPETDEEMYEAIEIDRLQREQARRDRIEREAFAAQRQWVRSQQPGPWYVFVDGSEIHGPIESWGFAHAISGFIKGANPELDVRTLREGE